MKRKVLYGLGAIVVATVTLGAVATGPYYAMPAWAQKLACATTSNCPRFIVLADWNNEAVLDRETGLVWQRSPGLGGSWTVGLCIDETTGNRGGWRLPTVNELASLFDPSATGFPFLPAGHPFTNLPTSSVRFWTLNPGSFEGTHRVVGYQQTSSGQELFLKGTGTDSTVNRDWCVRGGVVAGPQ